MAIVKSGASFFDRIFSFFSADTMKAENDYIGTLSFENEILRVQQRELKSDLASEKASHARLASQLVAARSRLARIAAQETPGANATVRKMAKIARGDA